MIKRTDPSKHLYQDSGYVTSHRQQTDGILARWLWDRSNENPANYADDYQLSAIADNNSLRNPEDRT